MGKSGPRSETCLRLWVKVGLRNFSPKNNHGSYETAGKTILEVANLRSGSGPAVELRIDKNPSIPEILQRFLREKFDRHGSGRNSAGAFWIHFSSVVPSLRTLAQTVSELQQLKVYLDLAWFCWSVRQSVGKSGPLRHWDSETLVMGLETVDLWDSPWVKVGHLLRLVNLRLYRWDLRLVNDF